MKAFIYAALLSTALISSAAVAQEVQSVKSFGLTLGASYFVLPHFDTGIIAEGDDAFDAELGGDAFGGTLGLSGGVSIGKIGDWDAAIGFSGFGSIGHGSSSSTQTFSGAGVVVIPGMSTPDNANISLSTSSGPGNSAANSTITHTNPQGGGGNVTVNAPINPLGTINAHGVPIASGANSFSFGAVATRQGDEDTAAAYGAVAASDGGVFIAAGDLTGLEISTDIDRSVLYTGADLTLALGGQMDAMSVQAYLGPSYRFLSQSTSSTISVDIAEALPSATEFPIYSMSRDEQLNSHYLGGIVGVSFSKPLSDTLTFSLNAEGGLYYAHDDYEGSESYAIEGGAGPSVPRTVVENDTAFELDDSGLAWSARITPSITMALAPNRQITFGGTLDYLSRVAAVERSDTAANVSDTYSGTDDGSLTYSGSSENNTSLGHGSMWSFSPTISFTGQF